MPSLDQILRERRRAARRVPTAAQEVARFNRARDAEIARRARTTTTRDPDRTPVAAPAPVPFSQTEAGLRFAAKTQRDLLTVQRENAAALARKKQADDLILLAADQKFEAAQLQKRLDDEAKVRAEERERARKANINQLRIERQGTFSTLMKSGDQARAVMFALGFGPENDIFDVRARALGTTVRELKGAQALRTTTQEALSRVLDRQVTIGREGVRGLGAAVKSARSFIQGGADVRTLLTSAFGLGSLRAGERPGISAARLAELTSEVTPVGLL